MQDVDQIINFDERNQIYYWCIPFGQFSLKIIQFYFSFRIHAEIDSKCMQAL